MHSGVGRNGAQRFGGDLEQQALDHRLVGVGERTDGFRQGEHHMVIVHRQQLGLAGFEPALGGIGLTLRARTVRFY